MENLAMFKKIPYGVKVRVRGNEKDGFIAEYAISFFRFMPFLCNWYIIYNYTHTPYSRQDTFRTLELAKEASIREYHRWIGNRKRDEEEKRVAKAQRNVVWKHP
jgi:hypothetical protein